MHFGLNSPPDTKPRIFVWRENKIKYLSELDKNNSRSYGKRPLKRLSPSHYALVSFFISFVLDLFYFSFIICLFLFYYLLLTECIFFGVQKSCEKFSCSRAHAATAYNITFIEKISYSGVHAPAASNVPFVRKVETTFSS